MAAAQYVDVPGYAALLLRKTYKDLALPGAIMDRAKSWWYGRKGIRWSEQEKRFTFACSGGGEATITFGYLDSANDIYRYQSAEFQFIGFDELTQFSATQFTYLFSRLRRKASLRVPLRMRTASNPPATLDGAWVKHRYLTKECIYADRDGFFNGVWWNEGRAFVPARLEDNPFLDEEAYRESLTGLDQVTRKQLEDGDWTAHAGGRFRRSWFPRYKDITDALIVGTYCTAKDLIHKAGLAITIWVDPANRPKRSSKYTAMLVCAQDRYGRLFILDVVREQLALQDLVPRLYQLVCRYNPMYVGIEANGFQLALANEARSRERYPRMPIVKEVDPMGKSKLTRATPSIIMAQQAEIIVPQDAPWLEDWFGELEMFTGEDDLDTYTDQVDTLAYAVLDLKEQYGGTATAITA